MKVYIEMKNSDKFGLLSLIVLNINLDLTMTLKVSQQAFKFSESRMKTQAR